MGYLEKNSTPSTHDPRPTTLDLKFKKTRFFKIRESMSGQTECIFFIIIYSYADS